MDKDMPENIFAYRCSQAYVQADDRKSKIVKTTEYTRSDLCVPRSEYDKLKQQADRLADNIQSLLDNDPNDIICDGGHTVYDLWSHEADKALAEYRKETE